MSAISGFESILFGALADTGQATFAIQGTAQVYQTLSILQISDDPERTLSSGQRYTWQSSQDGANWVDIGNNESYTIREQDEGLLIRASIGYFDLAGNYSVSPTSATTLVAAPTSTPVTSLEATNDLLSSVYSLTESTTDATLTGTEYTGAVGNQLDNTLKANNFGDYLSGAGGDDQLSGGTGSDVLYAGDGNDLVDAGEGDDLIIGGDGAGDDTYIGGDGIDTVKYTSSHSGITVDLSLGAATSGAGKDAAGIGTDVLSEIENVIAGNFDDTLIGNELDNRLDGLVGNDILYGGTGADTLIGGTGNDTYVVDNVGDIVTESSTVSSEIDTVLSSVSYSLDANTENLALTGFGNVDGTGNDIVNTIVGNAGSNIIDGNAGNDILYGGMGNDTFNFSTTLSETSNVDTIMDFTRGDHIGLSPSIFSALVDSVMTSEFQSSDTISASSATGSAHLLYNTGTGALYYDADGAGGANAVLFANVGPYGLAHPHPMLTAADFLIE